jgi:hypothetical protein
MVMAQTQEDAKAREDAQASLAPLYGKHNYDTMWIWRATGTMLIPFRPAFTDRMYWQRVAIESPGVWTVLDQVEW